MYLWERTAQNTQKYFFDIWRFTMVTAEFIEKISTYLDDLRTQEKAKNTIKSYLSDLKAFAKFLEETDTQEITKDIIIEYKEKLKADAHTIATINRRIVSINKFFKWAGADAIADTKTEKQQTANSLDNVLNEKEYERLLKACINPNEQGRKAGLKEDIQAWAIVQTLANTGIRFNELQFFTYEALKDSKKNGGAIIVTNKGKTRQIPICDDLKKLLLNYCKLMHIESGYIFGTRNGTPISNEQISRRLKKIAGYARINKSKIHPHAFRHLFAKTYMQEFNRLDELADILGHSNIQTTRIYSRTSNKEKSKHVNELKLIKSK